MRTFQVIVHSAPEGGFWGEIPAIEDCYSQGETIEELLANLREAAEGVLETLASRDAVLPEPSPIQIVELTV